MPRPRLVTSLVNCRANVLPILGGLGFPKEVAFGGFDYQALAGPEASSSTGHRAYLFFTARRRTRLAFRFQKRYSLLTLAKNPGP
jgi:hypothetical protein